MGLATRADGAITFGRYSLAPGAPPAPLLWDEVEETADSLLLLSRLILCGGVFDYITNDWRDCALRRFLTGEFFRTAFGVRERRRMLPVWEQDLVTLPDMTSLLRWFPAPHDRERAVTPLARAQGVEVYSCHGYGGYWLRSAESRLLCEAVHICGTTCTPLCCAPGYGVLPLIRVRRQRKTDAGHTAESGACSGADHTPPDRMEGGDGPASTGVPLPGGMLRFTFPAVFLPEEEPGEDPPGINVNFPDIICGVTCGYGMEDALYMARDLLSLVLRGDANGCRAAVPTPVEVLRTRYPGAVVLPVSVVVPAEVEVWETE